MHLPDGYLRFPVRVLENVWYFMVISAIYRCHKVYNSKKNGIVQY